MPGDSQLQNFIFSVCVSLFMIMLLTFRCKVIVHCFKNAHRVAVTDEECECGAAYMDVEFHKVRVQ